MLPLLKNGGVTTDRLVTTFKVFRNTLTLHALADVHQLAATLVPYKPLPV